MIRRTLAVVVAHPDDDAYAVAGSIALHADDPGLRWVLVHATDGGAGQIAPGVDATPATLGTVRRAETAAAWAAHGRPPDRHEWLGLADGHLAEVDPAELTDRVASILDEERPDVVVTFGPDGMTGHPDHVAIGAATDAAFDRLAADGGPGLRRLLHGALPQSVFERYNVARVAGGLEPWDPNRTYHLRGVPDATIGITVDTSSVALRVVAGLREHRSQAHVLAEPDVTDDAWARHVSREHLVIVRPGGPAPSPRLCDLFDALDS